MCIIRLFCGWVCPGGMCESRVLFLWVFSYLALSQALPPALDITALVVTEPQCADNLNKLREGVLSGKRWAEASTYLISYITQVMWFYVNYQLFKQNLRKYLCGILLSMNGSVVYECYIVIKCNIL